MGDGLLFLCDSKRQKYFHDTNSLGDVKVTRKKKVTASVVKLASWLFICAKGKIHNSAPSY